MITQKHVRKLADLSSLQLGGIEIVQTLAGGNGTDFHSVTIKDTKTGTLISFSRAPYSDMDVHATLPPKTEKRFVVIDINESGEFRSKPLKAEELDDAKEAHPGCQVDEIDVPVDE